jgi:hypothetical protein
VPDASVSFGVSCALVRVRREARPCNKMLLTRTVVYSCIEVQNAADLDWIMSPLL